MADLRTTLRIFVADGVVFDQLPHEEIDRKRKWLRLDPDYRAAIGALGAENG